MHRRPDLCGSSLDFEFIRQQLRQCIKINKIRPKFHFLTKIEIKVTYVIILFSCVFFTVSSPLEPLGSRCIDV